MNELNTIRCDSFHGRGQVELAVVVVGIGSGMSSWIGVAAVGSCVVIPGVVVIVIAMTVFRTTLCWFVLSPCFMVVAPPIFNVIYRFRLIFLSFGGCFSHPARLGSVGV